MPTMITNTIPTRSDSGEGRSMAHKPAPKHSNKAPLQGS